MAERFRRKADRIDPTRVNRHVIVLDETHIRRILTKYVAYYNELRTHRSLDKDVDESRIAELARPLIA